MPATGGAIPEDNFSYLPENFTGTGIEQACGILKKFCFALVRMVTPRRPIKGVLCFC
jgi:hypothetical protein